MVKYVRIILLLYMLLVISTAKDTLFAFVDGNRSSNWAGYIADQGEYTAIYGSWIVPTTHPTSELRANAEWIGIGGIHSNDLIQAGTETISVDGSIRYIAWYEILPARPVIIPLSIHAGDEVYTSLVLQETNVWKLDMTNATTGKSFTTLIRYASSLSSAQWIEERPKENGRFLPLAHFDTIKFTSASAISNGVTKSISDISVKPLRMIDRGNTLARPSNIVPGHSSFSVFESLGER